MVRIEATCPSCGTIECDPTDFDLRVCTYQPASYYQFTCPGCGDRVQKRADERAVEVLIAEGVTPISWELPPELLEEHSGPPLSIDDVLDMHLMLQRPDWFAQLVRTAS